jgi:hypothetical protein
VALAKQTTWEDLQNKPYSFEDYTAEFSKQYEAEEIEQRRSIFTKNLHKILEHNSLCTSCGAIDLRYSCGLHSIATAAVELT